MALGGQGVGVFRVLDGAVLGVVMADLVREFVEAVAIAWACFGLGVILFRMGCRDWHARYLSRGLLFLSPFVLTCFGVHATRENQQLAAIVAAKKGEAIDERVYLASVTTAEFGDGYSLTTERYSDGTIRTSGQMSATVRRGTWSDGGHEASHDEAQRDAGGLVPLSSWRGVTW